MFFLTNTRYFILLYILFYTYLFETIKAHKIIFCLIFAHLKGPIFTNMYCQLLIYEGRN